MSIEKVIPMSKKVKFMDGSEIIVNKLPLGKYAQLLIALKNMPTEVMSELSNIDAQSEDNAIQGIFGLVGTAWAQVLDIISIGSGIDKDRIENDPIIGLDGGVELLVAIIEVNNLAVVIGNLKNVFNRPKK